MVQNEKTQWEKKTEEQKKKQMEYNKQWQLKKRAEAKGMTVEEYVAAKEAKKNAPKPVKLPKEKKLVTKKEEAALSKEFEKDFIPVDNSERPEIIEVKSDLYPEITFVMKRESDGPYKGYKVIEKRVEKIPLPAETV